MINDLVPTNTDKTISGKPINTVNARELHSFLNVGRDFSTWIKAKLKKLDNFVENQDFILTTQNGGKPNGGRPTKEYHLTIAMAKHFAMTERTDKGHEVRKYFIDCEKQLLKQKQFPVSFSDALMLAAKQAKERERLDNPH